MSNLTEAIQALKPEAQFSYKDNDYSTIEWHILSGKAPSQKEIDDKIAEIIAAKALEAANKPAQKSALLDRLGITEDEAKLLLS